MESWYSMWWISSSESIPWWYFVYLLLFVWPEYYCQGSSGCAALRSGRKYFISISFVYFLYLVGNLYYKSFKQRKVTALFSFFSSLYFMTNKVLSHKRFFHFTRCRHVWFISSSKLKEIEVVAFKVIFKKVLDYWNHVDDILSSLSNMEHQKVYPFHIFVVGLN